MGNSFLLVTKIRYEIEMISYYIKKMGNFIFWTQCKIKNGLLFAKIMHLFLKVVL
jgi:hypothetical protein